MQPRRQLPRGMPTVDHSQFTPVPSMRYVQQLSARHISRLRQAHAESAPYVFRCTASDSDRHAALTSWETFVANSSPSDVYSTQSHRKRSLREVWHSPLGMRMETSLESREGNAVRDWMSAAPVGSFVNQLHVVQGQLDTLGSRFSIDEGKTRHPSFVAGQVTDGGGTTHYDEYVNLALVATGRKTFYIARSHDDSAINRAEVRGVDTHERRGVNPYNSPAFLPSTARLDEVPTSEWSVADLYPGDILHVPYGDWHWVYSVPHTVMTNVWVIDREDPSL